MQISVQSAHRISLRRPLARTAARNSASSHALVDVRSSGEIPRARVASLEHNLDVVEWHVQVAVAADDLRRDDLL